MSFKAEHASSSSTISNLEATIRDKDKHIEILQGQRQRSGAETEEELGRVKRSHEKLEARVASLREQLTDKEVNCMLLFRTSLIIGLSLHQYYKKTVYRVEYNRTEKSMYFE